MRARFKGLIWLLALGGTISACHSQDTPCDVPVGTPVSALPVSRPEWVVTGRLSDGGISLVDLQDCCSPRLNPGCEATCPEPRVEVYKYEAGGCHNDDFQGGGVWICFVWAVDGGVLRTSADCYD